MTFINSLEFYSSYRLRRVFRKAINIADNVFRRANLLEEAIIPQIVHSLGSTYPELERNYEQILKVVSHETNAYRSLLTKSTKNFLKLNLPKGSRLTEIDALESPGLVNALTYIDNQLKDDPSWRTLSLENLYFLHTTYGLNEETLEKVAQEKRFTVEMDKFGDYLHEQRALSKQKLALSEKSYAQELRRDQLPKTDDSIKYLYDYDTVNKCYDLPTIEAKVLHVGKDDATDLYHIVLNRTNFYAVAGGQDADGGEMRTISGDRNAAFAVEMVELNNNVIVHSGRFQDAADIFKVGDSVNLSVKNDRRTALTQHHTGILNDACPCVGPAPTHG